MINLVHYNVLYSVCARGFSGGDGPS